MQVNVRIESHPLPIDQNQVISLVKCVLEKENVSCDEVNIYFVDTPAIQQLHAYHFNDPTSTDCISFPIDPPFEEAVFPKILGEIFVCPQTAIDYAQEHNLRPHDELALYIIHGLLHIIGYDDIEEKDRIIMREKEALHMALIKEKGCELHDTPSNDS